MAKSMGWTRLRRGLDAKWPVRYSRLPCLSTTLSAADCRKATAKKAVTARRHTTKEMLPCLAPPGSGTRTPVLTSCAKRSTRCISATSAVMISNTRWLTHNQRSGRMSSWIAAGLPVRGWREVPPSLAKARGARKEMVMSCGWRPAWLASSRRRATASRISGV